MNTKPNTKPNIKKLLRLPGVPIVGNHTITRIEPGVIAGLKVEIDGKNIDGPQSPRRCVVVSPGGNVSIHLDEVGNMQVAIAGRGHEVLLSVTPTGALSEPVVRQRRGRVWLAPGLMNKYK